MQLDSGTLDQKTEVAKERDASLEVSEKFQTLCEEVLPGKSVILITEDDEQIQTRCYGFTRNTTKIGLLTASLDQIKKSLNP